MGNVVQSSYTRYQPEGVAGAAATMHGWDADSRICESAAIGFGLAVSQGSADNGAVLGGALFVGVSVRDITLVHTTADRYELYDNMAVMTRGDVWVTVGADVVKGNQAHYNTSTGVISDSGGTAITASRFMTSASSGGLAILRLGEPTMDLTS
jgi:hypothetical protein